MKERIILAPGINGSELRRSLALHGVNCYNLRICGAGELARMALMRSCIPVRGEFVSATEACAVTAEAVRRAKTEWEEKHARKTEDDGNTFYFGNPSYSDIRAIAGAIRKMRNLVPEQDEENGIREKLRSGEFPRKNEALFLVYLKYIEILAERKALDSVSVIRKALAVTKPIDSEFLVLEEFPLYPLAQALLEKVSGGSFTKCTLRELFRAGNRELHVDSFKNCYGAANETESVLADIYTNRRIENCTVAVTDTGTYAQLFFDYALLYNIPVTFGCGIPVINSNPARLLRLYYYWMTEGFFGADALRAMLSSDVFDRNKLKKSFPGTDGFKWSDLYEVAGELRLTNHRELNEKRVNDFQKAVAAEDKLTGKENKRARREVERKIKYLPCIRILAEELAKPAEDFVAGYSYIRQGRETCGQKLTALLDTAAAKVIREEIAVARSAEDGLMTEDLIQYVLKLSVCRQASEAGKLHVTGLSQAFFSVRENLYIAGLSASKFPGTPKENYLLLDKDLNAFGESSETFKSNGRIRNKKDRLMQLMQLASCLGSSIHVSYSGLNVSELKKDNASSQVFELWQAEKKGPVTAEELKEKIEDVKYFDPAISGTRLIGNAYIEDKEIGHSAKQAKKGTGISCSLDKDFSPTALDIFFNCGIKFMLKYILEIPEPEEEDVFATITPFAEGNLAHALMEKLGNSDGMDRNEFLELSEKYFDNCMMEHPPLIPERIDQKRAKFLDMMKNAYDQNPHRNILVQEEELKCTHDTGVKLKGIPDRVEELEDGSCLVVDFKTGAKIKHKQDDISSCLQVLLYAYILEKSGRNVSGAEYRYIRSGKSVTCKYDKEMKDKLEDRLREFKEAMEQADFRFCKKKDEICKYCGYKDVCGRP